MYNRNFSKRPLTKTCSIYVLKDPVSGEVRYVGKTSTTLEARLKSHLGYTAKNHRSFWLNSLKIKNLKPTIELIEKCTITDWQEREIYWIQYYKDSGAKLTNSTSGGLGAYQLIPEKRNKVIAANKGKKLSEEHKRKISEANKGKVVSDDTRKKQSISRKNRLPATQETRIKISEANKGKKRSTETCAKISILHKGSKRSDEARAKMSLAQSKRKHTEESKAKISEALRNRVRKPHTEETKAKMSKAHKNMSAETRAKMSESAKDRKSVV